MNKTGRIAWRIVRWLLLLALTLTLLALAAWWALPCLPASTAQREAMALMEAFPKPEGRNAWPAVWFLDKAVPADQMQVLAEQDFADWQRVTMRMHEQLTAWHPPSDARYPPEALAPGKSGSLCAPQRSGIAKPDCFGPVRADLDGYARRLAQDQQQLARVTALDAYDFYRVPDGLTPDGMPKPALTRLPFESAALQHVQGDSQAATDTVCRQIKRMRRLYGNSGDLLTHMLLGVQVDIGAQLLSSIWAEGVPPAAALPPSCDAALAPVNLDEGTLCNDMRGEYARFSSTMQLVTANSFKPDSSLPWHERAQQHWLAGVGFVPEAGKALLAESFAGYCQPGVQQQFMSGKRDLPEFPQPDLSRGLLHGTAGILALVLNHPVGMYAPRVQDMSARHAALRTVRWLHQQPGAQALLVKALSESTREPTMRPLQQLLDERPAELRLQDRPFTVVADASGVYLQMPLYSNAGQGDEKNPRWALPLAVPKP